jgi:hypothetical protein
MKPRKQKPIDLTRPAPRRRKLAPVADLTDWGMEMAPPGWAWPQVCQPCPLCRLERAGYRVEPLDD